MRRALIVSTLAATPCVLVLGGAAAWSGRAQEYLTGSVVKVLGEQGELLKVEFQEQGGVDAYFWVTPESSPSATFSDKGPLTIPIDGVEEVFVALRKEGSDAHVAWRYSVKPQTLQTGQLVPVKFTPVIGFSQDLQDRFNFPQPALTGKVGFKNHLNETSFGEVRPKPFTLNTNGHDIYQAWLWIVETDQLSWHDIPNDPARLPEGDCVSMVQWSQGIQNGVIDWGAPAVPHCFASSGSTISAYVVLREVRNGRNHYWLHTWPALIAVPQFGTTQLPDSPEQMADYHDMGSACSPRG